MQRALIAGVTACLILVGNPGWTFADILIDFENTPAGIFSSYTEQGVTFTALSSGMLTSDMFGNAPNGTRGLIGVPMGGEGTGGGGGGGEGMGGGGGSEGLSQTASLTMPQLPMPNLPIPSLDKLELPPIPPPIPPLPGSGENTGLPGPNASTPNGFFPAIRADFDFLVNYVCVQLGDNSIDEDGLFLQAFGESGNFIGAAFMSPGGVPGHMKTLFIHAPDISYVIFGSISPSEFGSSVFADNFCAIPQNVQPVPEMPGGTLLLYTLGLAAVGVVAFRRRKLAIA